MVNEPLALIETTSLLDLSIIALAILSAIVVVLAVRLFKTKESGESGNDGGNGAAEVRPSFVRQGTISVEEMLDSLPEIVFQTDLDGRFNYISSAATDVLGYENAEFLDMSLPDIVSKPDRARVVMDIEHCLEGSIPIGIGCQYDAVRKDGCIIPVAIYMDRIRRGDNNAGLGGIIIDIKEQAAIRQRLQKLSTAIEQSDEMLVITDIEGNIEYVNPAFEKTTGYTLGGILGANPRILKTDTYDRDFYENLWNTILSGKTWRGTFTNRRKDGSLYRESATISPVKNGQGKVCNFVAIKRDITRIEELNQQLRQSQKMEAIGRMACEDLDADNPVQNHLEQILKASGRAQSLIDQLSRFGRTSSSEIDHIEINQLINDCVKMIRRLIEEDIELDVATQDGAGVIHADQSEIQNIVINLCTNARDAMPEGGRIGIGTREHAIDEERAKLHPGIEPGSYVSIAVEDSGPGIPSEIRDKIFDPFFTTKAKDKGTGLGLATVYGTIEKYNGFIELQSEEGCGSCFELFIPRAADVPAQSKKIKCAKANVIQGGGDISILFAEDEELVRTFTIKALTDAGFEVLSARDGAEAISIFERRQEAIDIALLDVIMPRKKGPEVRDAIRKHGSSIPIIFITGYTDMRQDIVLSADNEKIIFKPCKIKEIIKAIHSLTTD